MIKTGRPIVLTDRDGTLIKDVPYLSRLSDISFLPGVIPAIKRLNSLEIPVVVVTNQSGVARGYFSEEFVQETHRAMNKTLSAEGAHIDAFFYCPHLIEGSVKEYQRDCGCRKPLPGLLSEALFAFSGDASRSMMVGDSPRDILAGNALGCHTFRIIPGDEVRNALSIDPGDTADQSTGRVVSSFLEAVDDYLERLIIR